MTWHESHHSLTFKKVGKKRMTNSQQSNDFNQPNQQ